LSIASDHVAFFRDQRADRYVDTVTIRDQDAGTWNRTTKQYDGGSPATLYTGGALIRPGGAAGGSPGRPAARERGAQAEVLHDYDVELPFDAGGLDTFRPNHEITVDASENEADLVGQILVIQSITDDSYATFRLLRCIISEGRGDRG
jgi:hypothetical protein